MLYMNIQEDNLQVIIIMIKCHIFKRINTYLYSAICGGISGSCAAMLACSIDLTKCRL